MLEAAYLPPAPTAFPCFYPDDGGAGAISPVYRPVSLLWAGNREQP